MGWFKLAVDSLFWSFILLLFYMLLDFISPVDFGTELYTLKGYVYFYFYTAIILIVLRMPKLMGWNNQNTQK